MSVQVFDDTICLLGEGPLWHPTRGELFWFDILGKKLHRKGQHWNFDAFVSAAGWVDNDTLLIATQTSLSKFTISSGAHSIVTPLEADNAVTRSNDGRADPWGGFWIGTMGIEAEKDAGAIWRYYKGELRAVVTPITISNAICFAPDRSAAYYTDTPTAQVMRVALDPATGWPVGEATVHIDMTGTSHKADGAVVDTMGNLWTAQWGSARVACYGPDGAFKHAIDFPALQTSCPAFGGPDLDTLYCTSAAVGLSDAQLGQLTQNGRTMSVQIDAKGQQEHQVFL